MKQKITKIIIPKIFFYNFFERFCKKKKINVISYNHEYIFYKKKIYKKFNQNLVKKKFYFPLKIISDFFIFLNLYKDKIKKNETIIVEGIYPGIYLYIYNIIFNKNIKLIYYNTDWLVDKNYKFLSKILNNFFWKKINFFLIKKSILSISSSNAVIKEYEKCKEYNYLKKTFFISAPFTLKNNKIIKNKIKNNKIIKIIFLGVIRDSKLFINFFKKINILNKINKQKIIINLYGVENSVYRQLEKFIKKNNFNFIRFNGYFNEKTINKNIQKHDYGLHLSSGHSNYVISSKIYLYLSNNIPIITNKSLELINILKKFEFGFIIKLNQKNYIKNLLLKFKKYNHYKKNIIRFHKFSINNFYKNFNKIDKNYEN